MIELLSSNRRIDPSNGFGPLGAMCITSSGIKQNKSVVQLNIQGQHCQTMQELQQLG
jgi:hypothetical protein